MAPLLSACPGRHVPPPPGPASRSALCSHSGSARAAAMMALLFVSQAVAVSTKDSSTVHTISLASHKGDLKLSSAMGHPERKDSLLVL